MEFLRSFLRRHLAGKPVTTSGCVVKCQLFSQAVRFFILFFLTEQKNGVPAMLRAEDKLRQALEPAHIQLLSQISKLQGGVKDIVDMRNDLLVR